VTTDDEPILVTTVGQSPADERRSRERRYLITMGIRVIAFILAVVLTTGWIRVIAIILALVLPWVGVIMANAPMRRKGPKGPMPFTPDRPAELTSQQPPS
jgi:Flp pilus assembly protein TadB